MGWGIVPRTSKVMGLRLVGARPSLHCFSFQDTERTHHTTTTIIPILWEYSIILRLVNWKYAWTSACIVLSRFFGTGPVGRLFVIYNRNYVCSCHIKLCGRAASGLKRWALLELLPAAERDIENGLKSHPPICNSLHTISEHPISYSCLLHHWCCVP